MKRLIPFLLVLLFLLSSCDVSLLSASDGCESHTDTDSDGLCDICSFSVLLEFDIFSINDLHGKIADGDSHVGVDELTTYIKNARGKNSNLLLISAGDMWQGSSESNLTKGFITTEWMNELDFDAMAMGNHEYDWGEAPIEENAGIAEFPILAINIYDRQTNLPVEYCQSSLLVDRGGVQIGIIGAIGDVYSSIASERVEDVYFVTGDSLTRLVKAESEYLRSMGADLIVYVLHDGHDRSSSSVKDVNANTIDDYYDTSLSDGYVDLVFEAHTHQHYVLRDEYGVYHLQNGGDNKNGISYVEVVFNTANGTHKITHAKLVSYTEYAFLPDDPVVEGLLEKYEDDIGFADEVLGKNSAERNRNFLRTTVAQLYYDAGVAKWGSEYDIVLGGGYLNVRSPGYLGAGDVTYSDLQGLFPFDNELVLCSVKGRDLLDKFFNSSNDSYFIAYGDYGESVKNNIDLNATYYIIVDTYTSTYAPNNLTEVERYGADVFARDLLAEYVKQGGLE